MSYNLEELAQTLFEESGDALFLFHPETEYLLDANPMAQRLSGFTRKQLLGQQVTYYFRSEVPGGLSRLRHAYRKTGIFHSQEGFLLRHRQEGKWIPVNLTITRLHAEHDTLGLITARDITERRQAQAQLKETEAELRQVLASISDFLWSAEIDATGRWTYRYYSPVVEQISGRPPEYFLPGPERWLSTVHVDDRALLTAALARLRGGDSPHEESEYRIVRPDDSIRWVRDSVMARWGQDGCIRLDGVVTDITERKRVEQELTQERDLLHTLMENVPTMIYLKDSASRYTRVNRAKAEALGLSCPEEAIGRSDADFYPKDHARALFEDEQQLLRTGQPLHDKLERRRGEQAEAGWILSSKIPIVHEGQVTGIVGVARDVTEHKQAEEAIRASEAKYRTLIENLEQSVFLKDQEFRFVAANPHFCRGLGLLESEVLGKTDFDFYPVHLAEKYRADDRLVLAEGKKLELEEQNVVGGRLRIVRVVKTPLHDAQGGIVGVLGIFWDVTEQRSLEAQLRQAQKMEAVGQLAGGVAHDFNNLLTAILGNISLTLSNAPPDDPNRDLLSAAEKATLRAAELTSQLLGFSRRTLLRPAAVDLNGAIQDTVRILRRTIDPRINLEVRSQEDLWTVHADASQMNQILMNLCLNARDAMPQGGRLLLETDNIILPEDFARLHLEARPGEFVRLRVSDTGHGIPAEIRGRIFEPFFTTKEPGKGTGLGLAMVFGILKQHHGWIDCYSEVGQGTRFDVYLPRHHPSPEGAVPELLPCLELRGQGTILVADDEPMIRDLARTILQHFGYEVLLAEDGLRAVELYQREKERIDLIILDLTMPRLSGRDALHLLLKVNPRVRVLFASGYSAEHVEDADNRRILGFVSKPYHPEELARAVQGAFEKVRNEPRPSNHAAR